MSSIHDLAKIVHELNGRVRDLEEEQRLGNSSMVGSIGQYDPTGQLVARYGAQWDGANGAVVVAGPTPPTPAVPTMETVIGGVTVRVDGTWAPPVDPVTGRPVVAPSDFKGFEIQVSDDPNFPEADTPEEFALIRGPMITSARGGDVFVPWTEPGTPLYARVIARAHSGKFSPPSMVAGPVASGLVGLADLGFDIADYSGGTTVHYGPESSPPTDPDIGDLWLVELTPASGPTPAQYETRRWVGAEWLMLADQSVTEALQKAVAAQTAADSKAKIFTQSSEPVWTGPNGSAIWFDSDDGHRPRRWNGTAFVDMRLGTGAFEPNSIVASDILATGTITAALLEAVMILVNVILTADPSGPHIRIDSEGVRSFAPNPDGEIVETSRFGGVGADRVLITDPTTGAAVASINEAGFGSLSGLSVNGPMYYYGNTLDYLFDQIPQGEVVRAGVEASQPATTTALGAYDVEWLAFPGRSYHLSTTPINLSPSASTSFVYATLTVRPSAEGPPSVANGKPIVAARGSSNLAGGVVPITLSKRVSFNELFPNNTPPNGQVPTKVRALLVYGVVSGGGSVNIFSGPTYPTHTYVDDMGWSKPFTGAMNNGSGAGGSAGGGTLVTTQTLNFATTYCRTYNGSNSGERSTTEMVQGYTPYYSSAGSAISLMGFQDLTGVLAGATIHWAALYMNATHWHYDSGGEVMLGAHSLLNDTGPVKPGSGLFPDQLRDGGWPKPGGKWIYLPASWFAGLISGATRGFTLGNGATTNLLHYGNFVSAGSGRPVLRINFSK